MKKTKMVSQLNSIAIMSIFFVIACYSVAVANVSAQSDNITVTYSSDNYTLADFENAVITENWNEQGRDTSKTRVLWNTGIDNSIQYDYPNHNQSISLALATSANAHSGQKALQVTMNFGKDLASETNWGALLTLLRSDSDGVLPYNFSNYQTLSFYAKAPNIGTDSLEAQIKFIEYHTDSNQEETWETDRFLISQSYQLISIGMNATKFKLSSDSKIGDKTLNLANIKMVMLVIYKNGIKDSQTIYIDDIKLEKDTAKPIIQSIQPQSITEKNFQVTINVTDASNLDPSEIPTLTFTPDGGFPLSLAVKEISHSQIIATGILPDQIKTGKGKLLIQRIKDIYKNSADDTTCSLNINIGAIVIHNLETLDTIQLMNTQNALSIDHSDGYPVIKTDLNLSKTDNWGSIIQIPVATAAQNFSNQTYLTYQIRSKIATDVQTKLALIDNKGQRWLQKESYSIDPYQYYITGVRLQADQFNLDPLTAKEATPSLNFLQITDVQICLLKSINSDNISVYLSNLQLTTLPVLPPTTPLINNGISTITTTANAVSMPMTLSEKTTTLNIVSYTLSSSSIGIQKTDTNQYVLSFTNIPDGNHIAKIFGFDQNNNQSVPFYLSIKKEISQQLQAPVVNLNTQTTYAAQISFDGYAVDALATKAELLINNTLISTANIDAVTHKFAFNDISLPSTINIITVRVLDALYNRSTESTPILITKSQNKIVQYTIPSVSYPLFIEYPQGTQTEENAPTILPIQVNPNSEYITNAPKGRALLSDAALQIVDISLPQQILHPITISIPINTSTTGNVEAWYFNPLTHTWSLDGISDATIVIKPIVNQQNGITTNVTYINFTVSHLSTFGIFEIADNKAPVVESVKLDQKTVYSGDFVQPQPIIEIRLSDNQEKDSGIASWNITIQGGPNNKTIPVSPGNLVLPVPTYTIAYNTPSALESGAYTLKVMTWDAVNHLTTYITPTFNVTSAFAVLQALCGPNPVNPLKESANIQYQLTRDADVRFYIYSISGEKLFEKKISAGTDGGSTGFNSIVWDGRNRFGEYVANGVYVAYIIAKNEQTTRVAKVKIAVLK